MRKTKWIFVLAALSTAAFGAGRAKPKMTAEEARALFARMPATETTTPYHPTSNPGAQWFPEAGFGLFVHWGIHSLRELGPSWSMYDHRFAPRLPRDISVEDYYALAKEFDPTNYDPNVWMDMAASMGMRYVVLTTKHHDGFCLWPSAYGDYNVKCGADGRDLLREYVDAARRHGLKVGFYFSPRDWGYNGHRSGFGVPARRFDGDNKPELPFPKEENRKEYLKWIDYTIGQLSELLTQYGTIDVLWFDGANWMGDVPNDEYGNKIRNWIYRLQPGIVINPRWGRVVNPDYSRNASPARRKIASSSGDFYTFESKWDHIVNPKQNAGVYEPIWFEFCEIWKGWSWGYQKETSSKPDLESMRRVLDHLSTLRAFGGNYLLNVGPSPQGEIRSDILAESKELSGWIGPRKAAFWGIEPVKRWESYGDVPLTRRDRTLYAHLVGKPRVDREAISFSIKPAPVSARLLGKPGARVKIRSTPDGFELRLPKTGRDPLGEIVEMKFARAPFSK